MNAHERRWVLREARNDEVERRAIGMFRAEALGEPYDPSWDIAGTKLCPTKICKHEHRQHVPA